MMEAVPPKSQFLQEPHGVKSPKTTFFMTAPLPSSMSSTIYVAYKIHLIVSLHFCITAIILGRSTDYEGSHYPVLFILELLHLSTFHVFSPKHPSQPPSSNILHLSERPSSERK
jgi:hypothetical protein